MCDMHSFKKCGIRYEANIEMGKSVRYEKIYIHAQVWVALCRKLEIKGKEQKKKTNSFHKKHLPSRYLPFAIFSPYLFIACTREVSVNVFVATTFLDSSTQLYG